MSEYANFVSPTASTLSKTLGTLSGMEVFLRYAQLAEPVGEFQGGRLVRFDAEEFEV
jgi:hypothetical protein